MRSRPDVKVYLSPRVSVPGEELMVDVELDEETETPVDAITVRYQCRLFLARGQGKGRQEVEHRLYGAEHKGTVPGDKLTPGKHRRRVAFRLPEDLPPTYHATADAGVMHEVVVHVSIPWWPDRETTFVVPVVPAPGDPARAVPGTFSLSPEGPRRDLPFIEVSLATTELEPGDTLSGTLSIANFGGRKLRGIDVSFVENEYLDGYFTDYRPASRFGVRIYDGTPPENTAVPFRITLPEHATPSFATKLLRVSTVLEVRAVVAWGSDVTLPAPLVVRPRSNVARAEPAWVAPVGRERRLAVWTSIADQHGLLLDPVRERVTGSRGLSTFEIASEHRKDDSWLVAKLAYPDVGLDLSIAPRSLGDALATDLVSSGDAEIDGRIAAHAREYGQARPVAPAIIAALSAFERFALDDTGARVEMRGASHGVERVEGFVASVFQLVDALEAARRHVAPPSVFAADVPAWEAFASALRGRLDRGRMWIREGAVGTDRVELGATWDRSGPLLGTAVRVTIDPPLPGQPSIDDPSISAAARAAWRELEGKARALHVGADAVEVEIAGKTADPSSLMPIVDLAVALRRALAGVTAAGPFR